MSTRPDTSRKVVGLPRVLNDLQSLVSSDLLLGHKDHQGTVVIDFSSMEFARPFGTLVLGATLKELVAHRKRVGLVTSQLRARTQQRPRD